MNEDKLKKIMDRFWRDLGKASNQGKGMYMNATVVQEMYKFFSEQIYAARAEQKGQQQ